MEISKLISGKISQKMVDLFLGGATRISSQTEEVRPTFKHLFCVI
jgi:hypothetical protein